jgi:hypothetical protein
MVKYYFEDMEECVRLGTILNEWLGTPYRHRTGIKGLGCDCIHMVGCVLDEMGLFVFDKKSVPDYPRDWHLHNTREILSEGIMRRLNVEKILVSDNMVDGDIILSHYGKASSHAGMFYGGYVYQALDGIGVRKINFRDKKFRKQMKYAFRILA